MIRPPTKACKPYTKRECQMNHQKQFKANTADHNKFTEDLAQAKATKNVPSIAKITAILKKVAVIKNELVDSYKKCADHKCP